MIRSDLKTTEQVTIVRYVRNIYDVKKTVQGISLKENVAAGRTMTVPDKILRFESPFWATAKQTVKFNKFPKSVVITFLLYLPLR